MFGLLFSGYILALNSFYYSEEFLIGSFSLFLLSFVLLYSFLLIPRFFIVTTFKLKFYFLLFWCLFDLAFDSFLKRIFFVFSFSIFPILILFSNWVVKFFIKFFSKLMLLSGRVLKRFLVASLFFVKQALGSAFKLACLHFFILFKSDFFFLVKSKKSKICDSNFLISDPFLNSTFTLDISQNEVSEDSVLNNLFFNFSHYLDSRLLPIILVSNYLDVIEENSTIFYTFITPNDPILRDTPYRKSHFKLFLKRNKKFRGLAYSIPNLSNFFFISYFISELFLLSSVLLAELQLATDNKYFK